MDLLLKGNPDFSKFEEIKKADYDLLNNFLSKFTEYEATLEKAVSEEVMIIKLSWMI